VRRLENRATPALREEKGRGLLRRGEVGVVPKLQQEKNHVSGMGV